MEVILNGEPHSVDQTCTIEQLINTLQLDGKFAMEVNQIIIPRSEFSDTKLCPGDKIEIVQAIGGG
jgi:sulfur carrier protein